MSAGERRRLEAAAAGFVQQEVKVRQKLTRPRLVCLLFGQITSRLVSHLSPARLRRVTSSPPRRDQ